MSNALDLESTVHTPINDALAVKAALLSTDTSIRVPDGVGGSELRLHGARFQLLLWAADNLFPRSHIGACPDHPDAHRGAMLLTYCEAMLVGVFGGGVKSEEATTDAVGNIMEAWLPFHSKQIKATFWNVDPDERLYRQLQRYDKLTDDELDRLEELEDQEPVGPFDSVEFLGRKLVIEGCSPTERDDLIRYSQDLIATTPDEFASVWRSPPDIQSLVSAAEDLIQESKQAIAEASGDHLRQLTARTELGGVQGAIMLCRAALWAGTAENPGNFRKNIAAVARDANSGSDMAIGMARVRLALILGERLERGDWERDEDYDQERR